MRRITLITLLPNRPQLTPLSLTWYRRTLLTSIGCVPSRAITLAARTLSSSSAALSVTAPRRTVSEAPGKNTCLWPSAVISQPVAVSTTITDPLRGTVQNGISTASISLNFTNSTALGRIAAMPATITVEYHQIHYEGKTKRNRKRTCSGSPGMNGAAST